MTIRELKECLNNYPEDTLITYRHNQHGRIDIDTLNYKEETDLKGNRFQILTFEASFSEEDLL